MGKLKDKIKRIDYMHYVAVVITLGFVAVSILVFPNAYVRIWESLCDVWSSIKFYFSELFGTENNVYPSVIDKSSIGFSPVFGLPETWAGFKTLWSKYWKTWIKTSNFKAYLSACGNFLFKFSRVVLLVIVPLVLLLYLFFQRYLTKENNNYNKDSKPLKFIKWLASVTYIPVKNWICKFWNFLKEHAIYKKLWLFIWVFNFNIITIFIEFVAFYLFFVISFRFNKLYIQFYKLAYDLSVMFSFIPLIGWLVLGYIVLCKWRKKIGYSRLNHYENKNCGFINERPIVLMLCGTMGKKKTTVITDISLSQEKMFRDKAYDKLLENDLKFPYFPWINLENTLKRAMKTHQIYNLATIRAYIQELAYCFYLSQQLNDKAITKCIRRFLKRKFGINFTNLCFDYDYQRYGLYYDDKLKVVDLWQVIETYAQLYFIYVIESSLIISNYSIRTDNVLLDNGNFPLWDSDFFHRESKDIDAISRHAHIVDFDALRLGKKLVNSKFKDSFDFGVVNITEIGKERKNSLELQGRKALDDTTNQKNDGFNNWLKMVRHSATVDYFPFVRVITDEQRPESLGADARDLLEIVHIDKTNEQKLAMPFFTIAELVYSFIFSKFEKLYHKYRFVRSDNTLPMYMLKKMTATLGNFYNGIYNTFGYCKLDLSVENGTQDGQLLERKYFLMNKKIYSNRFSTDCFSDFFAQKNMRSPVGINDLPEYETEKATFEELKKQNSYFINDLTNVQENDD